MVQLPEPTPEDSPARAAGDSSISAITRERVRRVIGRMNDGTTSNPSSPDLGFRAFRLTKSHFKVWDGNLPPDSTDALNDALDLFADSRAADADSEAMLYELMLKSGIPITAPVVTETAPTGQPFHAVQNGALIFCLADPIQADTLRHVIALSPQKIVCLDASFGGSDALKTNLLLEARAADVTLETV